MPRNGGGNYYLPPGTEAAPDTTVESARYNNFTGDVEQELNRLIDTDEAATIDTNTKVAKAGDTMTGHLTLPTGPAAANAVRKDYVDSAVSTGDALKVAKAGDTMSGTLTFSSGVIKIGNNAGPGAGVWYGIAGNTDRFFVGVEGTTDQWRIYSQGAGNVLTVNGGSSAVKIPGSLQIGGAVHAWAFDVKPRANCNLGILDSGVADTVTIGNLNDAGTAWGPISIPSPTSFSGTLNVGGVLTASSTLNVSGTSNLTGSLTCSSSIFTSANFHLASGNGLYFEGSYAVRIYWDGYVHCSHGIRSDGSVLVNTDLYTGYGNANSGTIYFGSSAARYLSHNGTDYVFGTTGNVTAPGNFKPGSGFQCKQGSAGGYSNTFNYYWNNSKMEQWVDNVNTGQVTVTSDYRAKKDVADLPGMWDAVKALHPISFQYNDWTPPWHEPSPGVEKDVPSLFVADGVDRWGFLAHELQEALIMDAATGYKDTTEEIQSPNPWTVIAALTKALQEAMARIEALEAR